MKTVTVFVCIHASLQYNTTNDNFFFRFKRQKNKTLRAFLNIFHKCDFCTLYCGQRGARTIRQFIYFSFFFFFCFSHTLIVRFIIIIIGIVESLDKIIMRFLLCFTLIIFSLNVILCIKM